MYDALGIGGTARSRPPGDGSLSGEFDPGAPNQARFDNLGKAGFPDARDQIVGDFIQSINAAGPDSISAAAAAASEAGRRVAAVFAERAATRAVRDQNPALLNDALVALVIAGLGEDNYGAIMPMAVVQDAAQRCGKDFQSLIEEVSVLAGSPGSDGLRLWLTRDPEDATLAAMGYTAEDSPDGIVYKWS